MTAGFQVITAIKTIHLIFTKIDVICFSLSYWTRVKMEHLQTLVLEAVSLVCQKSVHYSSELSIEGLIGVTVDKKNVHLISIKETLQGTTNWAPQMMCAECCHSAAVPNPNSARTAVTGKHSGKTHICMDSISASTSVSDSETLDPSRGCIAASTPATTKSAKHSSDDNISSTNKTCCHDLNAEIPNDIGQEFVRCKFRAQSSSCSTELLGEPPLAHLSNTSTDSIEAPDNVLHSNPVMNCEHLQGNLRTEKICASAQV